ncbi:alpha/beta hydrolase-fold protein [Variovorax sp. RHLX14]|uniref:alpha/beta hydrolase-fold protein n=1 Tax=Variovorax sp. RHLX14 TaxID=1259731 RepID=UPI003F460663
MSGLKFAARCRIALLSCAALFATGCVNLRSASAPMYTQTDASQCVARADTLIVMLPGVYSYPDEFVREGFVKAVQDSRLAADVVRVDAHLGYYHKNAFVERLRQDVIGPAKSRGYRAIWIFGISLGGFGGLIYAQEHPEDIAGVVALAPYLGAPTISDEVAKAGGLMRWSAAANPVSDVRSQRETALWTSLQRYGSPMAATLPQLWLGYGKADRFATSNGLLGAVLPPERVFTTEGGHDWAPWLRLWKSTLATLPVSRCSS